MVSDVLLAKVMRGTIGAELCVNKEEYVGQPNEPGG